MRKNADRVIEMIKVKRKKKRASKIVCSSKPMHMQIHSHWAS